MNHAFDDYYCAYRKDNNNNTVQQRKSLLVVRWTEQTEIKEHHKSFWNAERWNRTQKKKQNIDVKWC